MMTNKILALLFMYLIAFSESGSSQTIEKPNYALKSHETLEILRVELSAEKTVIYFTIVNLRSEGGTFCADGNISIFDPSGAKLKLKSSSGIPVCPDSYKFRRIGEKLQFTLEFPPLKTGTRWIDIVEECESDCFWFYGLTLEADLNKKLDEAFVMASKGKPADNIILFKNILDSIDSQNLGIEGLLYINIINAAIEDADKVNATVWYKRLASSHAPRAGSYIKYLNDRGIKY
jgi:hypothetical protein